MLKKVHWQIKNNSGYLIVVLYLEAKLCWRKCRHHFILSVGERYVRGIVVRFSFFLFVQSSYKYSSAVVFDLRSCWSLIINPKQVEPSIERSFFGCNLLSKVISVRTLKIMPFFHSNMRKNWKILNYGCFWLFLFNIFPTFSCWQQLYFENNLSRSKNIWIWKFCRFPKNL